MLLSIVECSDNLVTQPSQSPPSIKPMSHDVEVIGPLSGPSAAAMRNAGAQLSQGRWLFFKDHDCQVPIASLLNVCRSLDAAPNSPVVIGGIYKDKAQKFIPKVYNFIQRTWVQTGLVDQSKAGIRMSHKLLGGALLVKSSVYNEAGGFSESIGWGGEELEFVNRVRQRGYKTGVSFRLIAQHQNNLGLLGFVRRAWFQNFNPGLFSFKRNVSLGKIQYYFRSPMNYWPAVVLFLGVGVFANFFGKILPRKEVF